jgi:hypothetical protein
MPLLAENLGLITHFSDSIEWKCVIDALYLLKRDNIGMVCFDKALQLVQSGSDAIDIERYYFH